MDQCKIISKCKWGYYNICHIDSIKFISTKFWNVTAIPSSLMIVSLPFTINVTNITIPSFVSWFRILSQYGVGIVNNYGHK
jgi:hypothetical protein